MLEKYSKSKAYMYVRKKKSRAGKKKGRSFLSSPCEDPFTDTLRCSQEGYGG